jgi:hypothetical protein
MAEFKNMNGLKQNSMFYLLNHHSRPGVEACEKTVLINKHLHGLGWNFGNKETHSV